MASTTQALAVPGYEVVQFLGNGARSTIWQIRDRRNGGVFALKRVVKRQNSDGRFLEQAANEFRVGSTLDHPVIRRVCSLRRVKRWLALREIHLVMEYCEGRTVQEARPGAVRDVVRVFAEVGAALAHMNSSGFVHADTKPNNIMVAPGGTVKVIDLGQSCPLGTVKQRIQGTPDFIAPEQVRREPLDARTDVFNFGAALYWTLTGRPIPTSFPQNGSVALVRDMVVQPPEEMNPQVTAPLSKLIMDCIALHPRRRPSTMNEVNSRLGLIAHTLDRNGEGG